MVGKENAPWTSRLDNLQSLAPNEQTNLIRSIAVDIQTTFSRIGQHLSQGTLHSSSADPIYDVARKICKRNFTRQQLLKKKIHQLRVQRHFMRKEYTNLCSETRALVQAYSLKIKRIQERAKLLEMRLSCLTQE